MGASASAPRSTAEATPTPQLPIMPVKIHAMPPSANAIGPCILAAHAECGGLEMCNLMEGAHQTEAFSKINPYQHIPALEDGDFAIGESVAILRYIALKYKPELYPAAAGDFEACGTIDFAIDAFLGEVFKQHVGVVYTVFGFAAPPEDQAAATSALMAALDKWGKTFLKGKTYVLGDKLSIADFKVVPFFWSAMCCEPKVPGLEVPAQIKEYVNNFFGAVEAAKIMKECGGFAIAEFAASKDALE